MQLLRPEQRAQLPGDWEQRPQGAPLEPVRARQTDRRARGPQEERGGRPHQRGAPLRHQLLGRRRALLLCSGLFNCITSCVPLSTLKKAIANTFLHVTCSNVAQVIKTWSLFEYNCLQTIMLPQPVVNDLRDPEHGESPPRTHHHITRDAKPRNT